MKCFECNYNAVVVKYPCSNGTTQPRYQCHKCGWISLQPCNKPDYYDMCNDADLVAYTNYKRSKTKKVEPQNYDLYISTSEIWKRKSKWFLASVNYKCRLCKGKAEHVHHLTYNRLGDELESDLLPLCVDCHNKEHQKKGLPKMESKDNSNLNKWSDSPKKKKENNHGL